MVTKCMVKKKYTLGLLFEIQHLQDLFFYRFKSPKIMFFVIVLYICVFGVCYQYKWKNIAAVKANLVFLIDETSYGVVALDFLQRWIF